MMPHNYIFVNYQKFCESLKKELEFRTFRKWSDTWYLKKCWVGNTVTAPAAQSLFRHSQFIFFCAASRRWLFICTFG